MPDQLTEQTALAVVSLATLQTVPAIELFKPGTIDLILGRIEAEARAQAEPLEISTEANRTALASLAYKVARSKTYIDDQGKALGEDLRTQLNAINDERKRARERLDTLKDEIRKPLTEWENLEKDRVANHEQELTLIEQVGASTARSWQSMTAEAITASIKDVESDSRNWQEFAQRAAGVKAVALNQMKLALVGAEKLDAERVEAERLRKEAAEQAIKEREAAAARAATQAAEERARQAAEAAQRAVEIERQRQEQEIEEAERQAAVAEERAKQAEARRVQWEKDAELRAAEVAKEAKRAQERAIEAERQRVAAEAERERVAAEKREANKRHRMKVNREAARAIINTLRLHKIAPAEAQIIADALVMDLSQGLIPHVSVEY